MLFLKEQHLFELSCHLYYLGEKKVMKERGERESTGESQSTTEYKGIRDRDTELGMSRASFASLNRGGYITAGAQICLMEAILVFLCDSCVSWICNQDLRLVNSTGEEVLEVRVNVSSADNLTGYRYSATVALSFLMQIYL